MNASESLTLTAGLATFFLVLVAAFQSLPVPWQRSLFLALLPALAIWLLLQEAGMTQWMLLLIAALYGYQKYWAPK